MSSTITPPKAGKKTKVSQQAVKEKQSTPSDVIQPGCCGECGRCQFHYNPKRI